MRVFLSINHFRILYSLMLLAGSFLLNGQNLISPQKRNEEIFTARTKQLNEFIDRFNMKSDFNGNPPDSAFISRMPRGKMLAMLFDLKDPRTYTGSSKSDQQYMQMKKAFIEEIGRKNLTIDKFSSGIIAEARTRVLYKGQPATVSLFLSQENAGKGGVKWVIMAAKGEVMDVFSKDTSMIRFIPPSSHETAFINLKRALEDTDHLPDYASADFKQDQLSTFFFCVKTGLIKYEYVEKVAYHILDIPGWYFRVEDFNREDLNSGWLISDLSKSTINPKEFLKNL